MALCCNLRRLNAGCPYSYHRDNMPNSRGDADLFPPQCGSPSITRMAEADAKRWCAFIPFDCCVYSLAMLVTYVSANIRGEYPASGAQEQEQRADQRRLHFDHILERAPAMFSAKCVAFSQALSDLSCPTDLFTSSLLRISC